MPFCALSPLLNHRFCGSNGHPDMHEARSWAGGTHNLELSGHSTKPGLDPIYFVRFTINQCVNKDLKPQARLGVHARNFTKAYKMLVCNDHSGANCHIQCFGRRDEECKDRHPSFQSWWFTSKDSIVSYYLFPKNNIQFYSSFENALEGSLLRCTSR